MHYDLCDKNGKPAILEEKFDESIPFGGTGRELLFRKTLGLFF